MDGLCGRRHLNVAPTQKATEWELTERTRLEAAADQGTLVLGIGAVVFVFNLIGAATA